MVAIEETLGQMEKVPETPHNIYDILIIGAGPAGMSAAVCASRANMNVLLIEKAMPGGETSISYKIDNYLGFPKGITGDSLGKRMEEQLFEYNVTYIREDVTEIRNIRKEEKTVITDMGTEFKTKAILYAVGLEPKPLGTDFERQFLGRGISYYAQCDASRYEGKDVAVVGGGNCACYAAEYLSDYVNKLYIIHRSDFIKAVRSLKDRVLNNPKIVIMWDSEIEEVFGIDKVEKIKVRNTRTNQYTWIDTKGIFVNSGRIPPKELLGNTVNVDESGFIVTDEYMRTNVPGVYAAGDIRAKQIRQIATAVSDGMIASINIERDIYRNQFHSRA
ncbi:FAD-dependent oxidoreductase [bacterium]|jgi:thioredoxin reductase (NADPH)|nr:FAD-dependent oxidoreductase [bacterium]